MRLTFHVSSTQCTHTLTPVNLRWPVVTLIHKCVLHQFLCGWMFFLVPSRMKNMWTSFHYWHTDTHTHLMAFCQGLPRWPGTRKVKPIWILLKKETLSGSGISWAICKSAPHSRQITMPASHHSVFLQAGCPSCRPTNSIKALKALSCEKLNVAPIMLAFEYPVSNA